MTRKHGPHVGDWLASIQHVKAAVPAAEMSGQFGERPGGLAGRAGRHDVQRQGQPGA